MVDKLFFIGTRQSIQPLQGLRLEDCGALAQTLDEEVVIVSIEGCHTATIIIFMKRGKL